DGAYLQSIRNTSREIGKFLGDLSKDEPWKNTIVVFTSDHGEGLEDHPGVAHSRHHGNLLYRSQTQVPLIVFGPGAKKLVPHRVPQLVRSIDIAPTILDFAGAAFPAPPAGESLRAYV